MSNLVDFIAQYDKDFPRKIKGATPEKIKKLEELANTKLPSFFKEVLASMGEDSGGFNYA